MRSLLLAVAVALATVPAVAQEPFWTPAAEGLPLGPVTALHAHDGSGEVLTGTLGGLYRLRPDGARPLSRLRDTKIDAVEASLDGALYAVSGTDSTLFRSDDGGKTWDALPIPGYLAASYNYHLAPLRDGLVYGFIQDNPGCDTDRDGLIWHRSTDGGTSWACLPDDPVLGRARDVIATDDGALLAASQSGVYRSTDGGFSWTQALDETGEPFALNASGFGGASGPFVLVLGWEDYAVYRSADGGQTWAVTTLEGFATSLAQGTSAHGDAPALFAGRRSGRVFRYDSPPEYYPGGVFRSDDGGLTWNETALGDTSVVALATLGTGDARRTLLAAGYSGLFQSPSGGASWAPYDDPLDNQWVLDVAFGPGGAGYVSTYPRRLHRIDAGAPAAWEPVTLPPFDEDLLDYGESNRIATPRVWELDVAPDGTVYASDGNLLRSNDEGQTWEAMPVGFILEDLQVRPDGSLLAASVSSGVFRSADRGVSWARVGSDLSDEGYLRAVAVGPDGTVYAGGFFALYVLEPEAETWTVVPLEGYLVQDLVVGEDGRVWAGTWRYVEVAPHSPSANAPRTPFTYDAEYGTFESDAPRGGGRGTSRRAEPRGLSSLGGHRLGTPQLPRR